MRVKKPLPLCDLVSAVLQDVEKHFEGRLLPYHWRNLVLAMVQPYDFRHLREFSKLSKLAELGNVFSKCITDNPDLTLEILNYARECHKKYIAENCTQAGLIRANLLIGFEQTILESHHPFDKMSDKGIRDRINSKGSKTKVTAASVRTARKAFIKSHSKKRN